MLPSGDHGSEDDELEELRRRELGREMEGELGAVREGEGGPRAARNGQMRRGGERIGCGGAPSGVQRRQRRWREQEAGRAGSSWARRTRGEGEKSEAL